MKIKNRIISLLLTISLLITGVFVTGALADTSLLGEEVTAPTGSYTAPEGSFDPKSTENISLYPDIAFAAFESEEDFLSGKAPAKWFKSSDKLTKSNIGIDAQVKYPYVHLFADASTDTADQLRLADNQRLTINLGGYTLTSPAGIRVGFDSANIHSTYLKIMNGTFVHTGGQMHTRPGITRIFENVVYNSSTNCLAYDNGAALLEYKNCEINLSNDAALFELGVFNGVESRLHLIGTKLTQSVKGKDSLIRLSTPAGEDATSAWTFFFDGESSVTRESEVPLFTFSHNFSPVYSDPPTNKQLAETQNYRNFAKKITVIYESGFKISADALVDDYKEVNYNGSLGKYHGEIKTVTFTDADPILKQIMYKTGTSFEVEMLVSETDGGMYEYIEAPSSDTKWTPAGANDGVDYTGITYAVWKSEADYLLGKTPVAWYKDTYISSKNIGTTDNMGSTFAHGYTPGYVQMYESLTTLGFNEASGQVVTGTEQALIIDLGSNILNDSLGFRIGGESASHPNASLTVRNGTYNYKGGQMQTRPETTLIFDGVTVNVTREGDVIYDGGAKLIRYKNCTVNLTSTKNYFSLSGGTDGVASKFEIIGTTFNATAAPAPALFVITQTTSAGYIADFEITVDKTSTFKGPITSWMKLVDSYLFAHSSEDFYYDAKGQFTVTQRLTVEEGATFTGGAELSLTYIHDCIDFAASEAESFAQTEENTETLSCGCKAPVQVTVKEELVKSANDSYCVIAVISEPVCVHEDKNDDFLCDKCGADFNDGTEPPPPCDHVDKNDDFKCDLCGETYSDGDEPEVYPIVDYSDKGKYTSVGGAWVPDSEYTGITYGVWKSESDYLDGKAPDYWYTDGKINGARVGTTDSAGNNYENGYMAGYVHLFDNVENSESQLVTGDKQKLVINLAGFTLEDASGYRIGGSSASHPEAALTFKNGTIHMSGSLNQIQPRYDTTLIYDNVVIVVDSTNGDKNFVYGDCADYTLFRNSIIINNTGTTFFISTSFSDKGTARSEFRFENTELVYTVAPVGPVFDIRESTYGTCYWDFYFDKDSAVIGEIDTLFKLSEEFSGKHYPFKNTQNFYFEEGFTASLGCLPDFTCQFVGKDSLGAKPPVTLVASDSAESIFNMQIVRPGTTEPLLDCFGVECELGFALMSAIPENDYAYCYKADGASLSIVRQKRVNDKGEAILTARELRMIPSGAVITLLSDLTYDRQGSLYEDGRISGVNADVVFNLNSKSLYIEGYIWELSSCLTFRDGAVTVSGADGAVFFGDLAEGSMLVFDNVSLTVDFKDGATAVAVVELYGGGLAVKNSMLAFGANKAVISFKEGTKQTLTVEGSTVTAESLVITDYLTGLKHTYTVNESELVLTGALLKFTGAYGADTDYIDASIRNSSVKCTEILNSDAALTAPIYRIALSEVYFSVCPEISSLVGVISVNDGERIMPIEDSNYSYRVTVPVASFKANLLLESDFGVRFLIPEGTNIVSFKIDGTLYTVSDIEETVTYDGVVYKIVTVKNIAPECAQDSFSLEVVFIKDGINHTILSSYSVVAYLSTLLETDYSTVIKRLAAATADYIAAASSYEGEVNGELFALLNSAGYLANKPDAATPGTADTDLGTAINAIESAQLDLGSDMKIRFNLKSSYSGTLTVMDRSYAVTDGKVGELTYVEIAMPAHELFDAKVTVTGEGILGSYSLLQYVNSSAVKDGSDNLKALIGAFYTYCKSASYYYNAAHIG